MSRWTGTALAGSTEEALRVTRPELTVDKAATSLWRLLHAWVSCGCGVGARQEGMGGGQRCDRQGVVWQAGSGVAGREWCGRQGVALQAGSGVAGREWCGRQGVVWQAGSGVAGRKRLGAMVGGGRQEVRHGMAGRRVV